MLVFIGKFFKLLKPRRMKEWLGRFSTIKQFGIIFLGFAGLLVLLIGLGVALLTVTNFTASYRNSRFNNQLGDLARVKQKLAEVQLIGNEKFYQAGNRSTRKILVDIKTILRRNGFFGAKDTKTIDVSLRILTNASRGTVTYPKYQLIP